MKKNVLLFFTMIITLFVFCGKAYAVERLICIYGGKPSTMLVQDESGNKYVYNNTTGSVDLNDDNWKKPNDNQAISQIKTSFESDNFSQNVLTACPKNVSYAISLGGKMHSFEFYDERFFFFGGSKLATEYNNGNYPSLLDIHHVFYDDVDYSQQVVNNDWIAECTYRYEDNNDTEKLYFNEGMFIYAGDSGYPSHMGFTLRDLLNYYESSHVCPVRLYAFYFERNYDGCGINGSGFLCTDQYMISQYKLTDTSDNPVATSTYGRSVLVLTDAKYREDLPPVILPDDPPSNCQELLGSDLMARLDSIMDLIKIVVPILLIGFGIVDFTMAMFSSSAEEMNKCKTKFIKRIVAAVLVFISPIFVRMLLTIANQVWPFINPNACV